MVISYIYLCGKEVLVKQVDYLIHSYILHDYILVVSFGLPFTLGLYYDYTK